MSTTRSGVTALVTFNGAGARAFIYDRTGPKLTALAGFPMAGDRKPELEDRPGRVFQSFSARRSATEPASDPEQQLEREFVTSVAGQLSRLADERAFDHLIVAATPRALGYWREVAAKSLTSAVRAELTADHVNSDDKTLLKFAEHAFWK